MHSQFGTVTEKLIASTSGSGPCPVTLKEAKAVDSTNVAQRELSLKGRKHQFLYMQSNFS